MSEAAIIGERVMLLRQRANLSQEELAVELKKHGLPMRQQTIVRIEKGYRPLRLSEAVIFAAVLGVDLSTLADESTEVAPIAIAFGPGDHLDVLAGRCCPHCRHLLADHNKAVWNAGYAVGQRHSPGALEQGAAPALAERDRARTIAVDLEQELAQLRATVARGVIA